jgi:cytoskeleton protein RodZ
MSYRDSGSHPTIGHELTVAREAAGLAIADVAAQLRIRGEFLAALEEGRPDALPGVTYAIGYVRTYAAFLGLDVEQAVTRFKQEAAGLEQRTQLVFPSPAPEGRVPGFGLMFASVLLAGMAYGGWYWMSERGMSVYDMVPDVPERLAALIEGQTPSPGVTAPAAPSVAASDTVSQAATALGSTSPVPTSQTAATVSPDSAYTAANPTSVPVTARSSTGEQTAPVSPPAAAPSTTLAAATPPSAQTQAAQTQAMAASEPLRSTVPSAPRLSGLIGASEAAVPDAGAAARAPAAIERVIVRATGESWVQVRSRDGTTLFTRVLRNGDVYRVPDRSGLTLATGNAGALEIVVDGNLAPSLGMFGEVVRNIALDPARLAAGTAIAGRN